MPADGAFGRGGDGPGAGRRGAGGRWVAAGDGLTDGHTRPAGAWQDEPAWTGVTRAGSVDLPGEIAGTVAVHEVVAHGWDIAAATCGTAKRRSIMR